jgi:hypothetical protein
MKSRARRCSCPLTSMRTCMAVVPRRKGGRREWCGVVWCVCAGVCVCASVYVCPCVGV